MDGEYRQKINIELTESEAECLLSWILHMEQEATDDCEQGVSEMVSMIFARLLGAFPSMMESENVRSFLKQHGLVYEGVSNSRALIPRHRVLKQVEQELQLMRSNINAELTKLYMKETFVKNNCIKQVLDEGRNYPTEQLRLAEIWRRVRSDMNYKFIEERKSQLKSQLSRVSAEIADIYKTIQAGQHDLPLAVAL